ncbi:hypothetical protein J4455_04235 [Candidatus Woesearchaeota archaeon]|nr:hypothetical protein [Candidatus Woesearchaeota archaeon]
MDNNKKIVAFVLIFLVYFILGLMDVKAEIVNCCQWTNDNKFCVESTDINFQDYGGCKAGYLSSYKSCSSNDVSECKLGTCVPSDTGECLANKFKVECTHNNQGKWFSQDIRSVGECQVGCCNVGGSVCSLQEKKVCIQDLANGDSSAFNSGITNALECDNSCRGADIGTCKTENGCRSTTRTNCNGEFFANKYARDVIGCFVNSHAYKSCGDGTSDNDKYSVYWYDSNNNREEVTQECNYPDEICNDIDDKGGEDAKCVSTKCVEDCPDCYPNELKSGESVCSNVLGGHFDNEKRSKGLSNYILRCQWGVVESDNVDFNRERRCVEGVSSDGMFNAKWRKNNWQECSKCGEGNGAIPASDYLGFAPIFGQLLIGTVGKACSEGGAWRFDKCEDFGNGDCGSIFNDNAYDDDFIWPPLGSCNPQYPPGEGSRNYGDPVNRCNVCGQGGDSATNICTREECNSMGDCVFEPQITGGLGATAGLAIGTCGSAAFAAFIGHHLPFIGQAITLGAIEACKGPGPTTLYWGLIGAFYGVGAAEGSEISEYNLASDIITDGKVKLGPVLTLTNGATKTISEEDINLNDLNELNREEEDRFGKYLGISLVTKAIAPSAAVGLVKLAGKSGKFTTDKAKDIFTDVLKGRTDTFFEKLPNGIEGPPDIALTQGVVKTLQWAGLAAQFITTAKAFDSGICMPEKDKPITDNSRCDLCGSGEGQWYCTEERCNVLGGKLEDDPNSGHCLWAPLNETGRKEGLCLQKDPEDLTIPVINNIKIETFDSIRNKVDEFSSSSKSYEVPSLLSWNINTIKVTIVTNERADCRYSTKIGTSYEDSVTFGDRAFPLEHIVEINMTEVEKIGGITYYFKCRDVNNNSISKADDSNFLKIKFDKRPDTSAPIIKSFDPRNVYLPERINSIKLSLLVFDENDVESCKYSKDKINFDEMENTFEKAASKSVCTDTTINDCRGFSSSYSLTNGQSVFVEGYDKNITAYPIFVKCKDTRGNVMIDPYNTSIFVIPTFNVTINKPLENEKVWDRTPLINVSTGTIALCNYTISDKGFSFGIAGTEHIKEHEEDLPAGIQNLRVSCYDYAFNEVVALRTFEVAYDNQAPKVNSIYKGDRKLCISLDEDAQCKYSFEDVFPDGWNDANSMINSNRENCASLKEGETYYLMCMDSWINNATFNIHT